MGIKTYRIVSRVNIYHESPTLKWKRTSSNECTEFECHANKLMRTLFEIPESERVFSVGLGGVEEFDGEVFVHGRFILGEWEIQDVLLSLNDIISFAANATNVSYSGDLILIEECAWVIRNAELVNSHARMKNV